MISALMHAKSDIGKEDEWTSSFFDTLFLLPDDLVWNIIRKACYDNEKLPASLGKLLRDEKNFWPRWNAKGTTNNDSVEPDLFIRFEKSDLIIEAKKESNRQKEGQWRNERISYCNEFKDDEKNVVLIAIGGITSKENEEIPFGRNKTFLVVKTEWAKLYDTVIDELHRQEKKKGQQQTVLILQQLKDYCDYLGMEEIIWPQEAFFKEKENFIETVRIGNFESDISGLCHINSFFEENDDENKKENNGFHNLLNHEYTIVKSPASIKILMKMRCNDE